MKICNLLESYYPIIGGGESQSLLLNKALVDKNNRVTVITRRSEKNFKKNENIDGVIIKRILPTGYGHFSRWIMVFTSIPQLIMQNRNYDIIFVSGFRSLGITAVFIGKVFRKPCVLKADNNGEMSGAYFSGRLKKMGYQTTPFLFKIFISFRNFLLRRADAFVSLSSEITSEFKDNKIEQTKIYEIPNCFDSGKFFKVNPSEKIKLRIKLKLPIEHKIFIFTGKLLSTKGLPLLLRVWNEIQKIHDKVLLLVVGSSRNLMYSCEDELKKYVQENKLEKNVIFTGYRNDVHEYLKSSDIFLFPTEDEAFGISLIEAMACGLAVITTSIGGIKDFIKHYENGLLMNVGDFDQLYNHIELLLKDDELTDRIGQNAIQTVKNKYSKISVAESYIALFEKLNN